ncbi:uncharacterized protein TRIREDRAFT_103798 [Trichoderma reesei QM6a]|jgi:hypothetical protein|uniref:Predicted protein n=1 Tax=Hypocrea jecorina (strain QM6a) TaxID=431241 RepID=G0R9V1_HYPJQ|nr:uncharacterized protein TRIREDRAFT_103798 [Trichoderma reesei QM6a]EGR51746.1 predicted protein [Trichoderma reesei QM6a]
MPCRGEATRVAVLLLLFPEPLTLEQLLAEEVYGPSGPKGCAKGDYRSAVAGRVGGDAGLVGAAAAKSEDNRGSDCAGGGEESKSRQKVPPAAEETVGKGCSSWRCRSKLVLVLVLVLVLMPMLAGATPQRHKQQTRAKESDFKAAPSRAGEKTS